MCLTFIYKCHPVYLRKYYHLSTWDNLCQVLFRSFKRKNAGLLALLVGTLVFVILSIAMNGIDTANSESFANFGRIWLVAGSQASPRESQGRSQLISVAPRSPRI